MDTLDFRTVSASVRAARIAILVDEADPDWQVMCHGAIEFLSGTWGGANALIVPTDGNVISPLFWSLLEAFDPDYIRQYVKTGLDVRRSRPAEFAAILEREINSRSKNLLARNSVEKALESSRVSRWGISLELENELKNRLAPFFLEQHSALHSIIAGQGTTYRLRRSPPFCLTAALPER
jgi:hypothetical protein